MAIEYRWYSVNRDGVKPVGPPFGDRLSEAIGCQEGHRLTGEFTVMGPDGIMHRVCKRHLALKVREMLVENGTGVIVLDAARKGDCRYERPA